MSQYEFPDYRILIFAKPPVAGQVKTRMQPVLNPEQSSALHWDMLLYLLEKLSDLKLCPIKLMVAAEHPCWQQLVDDYGIDVAYQVQGDLGRRLYQAAKTELQSCQGVLLLGSDCPFVDELYLRSALKFLAKDVGVVFGPAQDGGYVLLGLRQALPQLFEDIAWGTEQVLAQSCQKVGSHYVCLPSLVDIDRPQDLTQLAGITQLKRWLCYAP